MDIVLTVHLLSTLAFGSVGLQLIYWLPWYLEKMGKLAFVAVSVSAVAHLCFAVWVFKIAFVNTPPPTAFPPFLFIGSFCLLVISSGLYWVNKAADKQIDENRENAADALLFRDMLPLGAGRFDRKKGKFVWVNDAMCETLGRTREELLTQPVTEFIDPDHVAPTRKAIALFDSGIVSKKPYINRYLIENDTLRGHEDLEWYAFGEGDSEATVCVVVTERERLRSELEEANKLLKQRLSYYRSLVANELRDDVHAMKEAVDGRDY